MRIVFVSRRRRRAGRLLQEIVRRFEERGKGLRTWKCWGGGNRLFTSEFSRFALGGATDLTGGHGESLRAKMRLAMAGRLPACRRVACLRWIGLAEAGKGQVSESGDERNDFGEICDWGLRANPARGSGMSPACRC